MAVKFSGLITVPLPQQKIAPLVVTTLRRFQWHEVFVNIDLRTITAQRRHRELIAGTTWEYDFAATIGWNASDNEQKCALDITIAELNYQWTELDCQKKYTELVNQLNFYASKVSTADVVRHKGARWASYEDLSTAGYLKHAGSEALDQKLLLTRYSNLWFCLPEKETCRHAIVCGPTGSGKTTGIFIPNLIERTGSSAIVTEATGSKGKADLYLKTSGYRFTAGQKIYYFNPDDPCSDRLNPLNTVKSYRDARRITEIIMQSTTLATHRGDQTWDMAERLLLTALILHAVGERANGNCHMGYVRDLLIKGVKGLEPVISTSAIKEARDAYRGFLANSTEPYRNLVAGGLLTRIDLWAQPRIRALTCETTIDFSLLSEQLFTWYIAVPADKPELKPLAALVFNFILDYVVSRQFKYPLALFLDEFTNFGYIRGMSSKLSIIRHDGIPVILGIQDYVQLELLYYKEAPLFFSQPATKVFFKPNDQKTVENISRALGLAELITSKVSSSGQLLEEKERKPLLTVDELMHLQQSQAIIFTPGVRPVLMQAISWQDYAHETDSRTYPLPQRAAVQLSEELTTESQSSSNDANSNSPGTDITGITKHGDTIIVNWRTKTKTYSSASSLNELLWLQKAYEDKDAAAISSMTETDYARLCQWIEQKKQSVPDTAKAQPSISEPAPKATGKPEQEFGNLTGGWT